MKNLILFLVFSQVHNLYADSYNPIEVDTTVVTNKNITYKVIQDAHNIFITIETDERKTSQALIRKGVTVYFDSKGKKKKKVYVRYPKEVEQPNTKRERPRSDDAENQQQNRQELIENMPQEATYVHFDKTREFHTLLNDLDIDISFDFLNNNLIKYKLRIPKHKIKIDQKKDLAKLTIGVLIGHDQTERPNNEDRQGVSGQQGGGLQGGGGQQGLQGGSGRPQGGGPPGGGGGGQRSPQENDSRTQAKVFWFKANLMKHAH